MAAQLWVLPAKLLSFPRNLMPNVFSLQDLILLWDLMSDIYQVSCRSLASEEIILCWLTELGCIFSLLYLWRREELLLLFFSQIMLVLMVLAVRERVKIKFHCSTVAWPPAEGSRNRWIVSGSWARQANKLAPGHCWLMQKPAFSPPSFLNRAAALKVLGEASTSC